MILVFIVALGFIAASRAQSIEPAASLHPETNSTMFWTTVFGFLSVLVTQLVALWKDHQRRKSEERQREWDLADRASARAELQRNVKEQKLETIATAVQLARVVTAQKEQIAEQIAENTELTKEVGRKAEAAYEAGNNFTQRIEILRSELFGKGEQIDHIEQVSTDTNEKVTELKEGAPVSGGTHPSR